MKARLVVSEVPAYVSLYDSRGWRLPSMAQRAVTAKEYSCWFNTAARDQLEGLVCVKVLTEFFGDTGCYVWSRKDKGCPTDRHFSSISG